VAQSKVTEFLQKTALNIIFPSDEYATNLIIRPIANFKTLSHDDSNSHSFSSDGHEFGAMALCLPRAPLEPPLNTVDQGEWSAIRPFI